MKGSCSGVAEAVGVSSGAAEYLNTSRLQRGDRFACSCVERAILSWQITAQIGPSAFRVDLPGLNGVHPVFHASLLEPYTRKGRIQQPDAQIEEPLRAMAEDVYEVEKITDRRKGNNDKWEYCIKWRGYPVEENSWEPGTNISARMLKTYWDS